MPQEAAHRLRAGLVIPAQGEGSALYLPLPVHPAESALIGKILGVQRYQQR